MKELNRTWGLLIAATAFLVLIIVGLLTHERTDLRYLLSPSETLALTGDPGAMLTPRQAVEALANGGKELVFVDLREPAAFEQGHVPGAVNIQAEALLSGEGKALLRKIEDAGQTAVLYGETPAQANGAWLLLRQAGFGFVKLYTGLYSQLDPARLDSLPVPFFESPKIDTAGVKALLAPEQQAAEPATAPAVAPKKQIAPAKREAAAEVEEEEGC
ncbi:MAG: rhodanese-like domain-containing protein [Saprospiraceae bacterium]